MNKEEPIHIGKEEVNDKWLQSIRDKKPPKEDEDDDK